MNRGKKNLFVEINIAGEGCKKILLLPKYHILEKILFFKYKLPGRSEVGVQGPLYSDLEKGHLREKRSHYLEEEMARLGSLLIKNLKKNSRSLP